MGTDAVDVSEELTFNYLASGREPRHQVMRLRSCCKARFPHGIACIGARMKKIRSDVTSPHVTKIYTT